MNYLVTVTQVTFPYKRDNGQHTLRKDIATIQKKKKNPSIHEILYSSCIGMLPHKNILSRPDNCFSYIHRPEIYK